MINKIAKKTMKKISKRNIKTIKNKNNKNGNNKDYKLDKIELHLLIIMLMNKILFLIHIKTPKDIIKTKIILLLKEIRNNNKLIKNTIKDEDLTIMFNHLYKHTILLNTQIKKNKINKNKLNKHKTEHKTINTSQNTKYEGGFYFKSIEDKGDQPITGNDFAKLLDEIDTFVYNAQYTDEGAFLRDPYTLMNMFRGNTDAFKQYATYHILPKYYQAYPPFIKWEGIKEILTSKWEDLPDYLLAYQSYQRAQNEYLVEKGLKSPDLLNKYLDTGFFNKLATTLDTNITKMQQLRNKYKGFTTGQYTFQVPL